MPSTPDPTRVSAAEKAIKEHKRSLRRWERTAETRMEAIAALTVADLRELAKRCGVTGAGSLGRDAIVEKLQAAGHA